MQLHSLLNLFLLACGNILSDGLCGALHFLGGDLQTSQKFHPSARLLEEGASLTDHRQHAPYPRRFSGLLHTSSCSSTGNCPSPQCAHR